MNNAGVREMQPALAIVKASGACREPRCSRPAFGRDGYCLDCTGEIEGLAAMAKRRELRAEIRAENKRMRRAEGERVAQSWPARLGKLWWGTGAIVATYCLLWVTRDFWFEGLDMLAAWLRYWFGGL